MLRQALTRLAAWYLGKGTERFTHPEQMPGWVDWWKTRSEPSKAELVAMYRGICYACAKINSEAFASVPLKLYVLTRKGERAARFRGAPVNGKALTRLGKQVQGAVVVEEVEDHPLLDLLDVVNDYLDGFTLLDLTNSYLEMEGNAYWYIERSGESALAGMPSAIWLLPSHLVEPKGDASRMIAYYEYGQGVTKKKFTPEQIVHFKCPSLEDPYRKGMPPVRAAFQAATLMDKHYSFQTNSMDNRARPDAVISPVNADSEFNGADEMDRFEARLNEKFRKGGAGGIMAIARPMKVEPLSFPAKDMEMLAFHGVSKTEVCNIFGVPLPFLSTETNLANMQAARELHARNAVLPRCMRFDQVINQQLIPMYDDTGRLFIAHDDPVPENVTEQLALDKGYLETGVRVINEVRADLGLPPVEWGDKPLLPIMLAPLDVSAPRPTNGTGVLPFQEQEEQPEKEPVKTAHTHAKQGHNRRLPSGAPIEHWLKRVFRQQKKAVLALYGIKRKDIAPVNLRVWTEEMARKAQPLIAIFVKEGGEALYQRLNMPGPWNVQSPRVREAISRASMRFCETTNETTSLELNEAIAKLREELAQGLVGEENSLYELRKRVEGVFDNAERFRATRIATTEASRAVHQGQYLAAQDSDLVVGFKWLLSSDACELCQGVAAENPDGIPLDGEFSHDDYSGAIQYPPLHPNCQCTVTELLRER